MVKLKAYVAAEQILTKINQIIHLDTRLVHEILVSNYLFNILQDTNEFKKARNKLTTFNGYTINVNSNLNDLDFYLRVSKKFTSGDILVKYKIRVSSKIWIPIPGQFEMGDRVRKKGNKGQWHGRIVGFYSTECTPIGYAVESEREENSVQIYPESALELYEGDI